MKGVSEIIAIILILMIVIALAALAYTWFSGVFASMTGSANAAIATNQKVMTTQFSIETAKNTGGGNVNLVIRNQGTQDIAQNSIGAFINDASCTVPAHIPILAGTLGPQIGLTNCLPCSCNNHVCYTAGGTIESITVTIGVGLQQVATLTC